MKHALRNHNQVAHYWASQSQPDGRAGNMFFDGPTLYSYGRHYAIARIYKRPDGRQLVLFNHRDYSVSTAQHTSIARRAVSHLTNMEAWDHAPAFGLAPDHKENVNYFIRQAVSAIGQARRAKKYAMMHVDARDAWRNCFDQYIEFFQLDTLDIPAFPAFTIGEVEEFQAKRIQYDAQESIRQESMRQRRMSEAVDKFNAWKAGADVSTYGLYDFPVALRVKGDQVETSRGASVPLDEARTACKAFLSGKISRGFTIGAYTTISADYNGVKIGCHDISADEIRRLDSILG